MGWVVGLLGLRLVGMVRLILLRGSVWLRLVELLLRLRRSILLMLRPLPSSIRLLSLPISRVWGLLRLRGLIPLSLIPYRCLRVIRLSLTLLPILPDHWLGRSRCIWLGVLRGPIRL